MTQHASLTNKQYTAYTILLSASVLFCLGLLPTLNLGLLFIFTFLLYACTQYTSKFCIVNLSIWAASLLLGLFIALYRPEHFNYPLIWSTDALYSGGSSFSLYVNLSKAIGGYLVVTYLLTYDATQPPKPSLLGSIIVTGIGIVSILAIAVLFFDLDWKPKIPQGIIYFVLVNLLVSVVAEEAFFRLLIQKKLADFFKNPTLGVWVPAIIATLIFALSHSTRIGPALALYFIAGLIYSLTYAYTKRFSLAITLHFGCNILHFLLLDYPLKL